MLTAIVNTVISVLFIGTAWIEFRFFPLWSFVIQAGLIAYQFYAAFTLKRILHDDGH